MKTPSISILPVDNIDPAVLKAIGIALEGLFKLPTHTIPTGTMEGKRPPLMWQESYNSTALLLYISRVIPGNSRKILAVTLRDLYSPIFSHLYGEAQLGGTSAIMSLYRLRPEFYRAHPDQRLFFSRCEKEALHEVGHTFGLVHCKDRNCLMYPSSTIDDTDSKSSNLCKPCTGLLRTVE